MSNNITSPDHLADKAEIEKLRHALAFYADERRYQGPNQWSPDGEDVYEPKKTNGYRLDVTRDYGHIAREALKNDESA